MEPCHTQTPSGESRVESWGRRAARDRDQIGISAPWPRAWSLVLGGLCRIQLYHVLAVDF